MTVGNDRRDPNLITFDKDQSFDFIRHLFNQAPLDTKKYLEEGFKVMGDDPLLFTFMGIKLAHENPEMQALDFYKGIIAGVAIALAASKQGPGSLGDFLIGFKKKGQNVTDIAQAFRKRNL